MICKRCNKELEGDEKFCGFCGAETIEKISGDQVQYNAPDKQYGQIDNNLSHGYDTNSGDGGVNGEIIVGVIAFIIGAVLTWITYEAASDGGTYFVFWGLMIYGGYKVIKGLAS
jgi:hypothetical protein